MSDESIVVTGKGNIALARLIAVKHGLRLETRGLRRSKGRSMRAIANQEMGTDHKTSKKAYEAYDKWLHENYGVERTPL